MNWVFRVFERHVGAYGWLEMSREVVRRSLWIFSEYLRGLCSCLQFSFCQSVSLSFSLSVIVFFFSVSGKFEGERLVVASPALSLEGSVKSAGNKT